MREAGGRPAFAMNSMQASMPSETEFLLGRSVTHTLTDVRVDGNAHGVSQYIFQAVMDPYDRPAR